MGKNDRSANKDSKKEKLFFRLFTAAVFIFGAGFLLWGQYNSSVQIFDAWVMRYNIDNVLEADSEYSLTAHERAQYEALLEKGNSRLSGSAVDTRRYSASTAGTLFDGAGTTEFSYTYVDNKSDTTVIILHGYNQNSADSAIYAPLWLDLGYNIIIPELRGHGKEESATTFGVWEKYDLFDLITAEGLQDDKVIICARGIGAAAAIFLAADPNYNTDIDLIVAESVYSDLKTLELRQLKRQFRLGDYFVGKFIDITVRKGLGFDPSDADLKNAAASVAVPILFISGGEDDFLGYWNTKEVYDSCAGEKELLVIGDAKHLMVYTLGCDEYGTAVRLMLGKLEF
ncbi:MAG: alpha/beta hydrolase [Clostridiales bacterium]|nr:alpha/beta hydrolase [Clostridiales bacterium]